MSKSSKEGWTWERKPYESQVWCVYCECRVLKSQSFGASYRYKQVWHTKCGSGPKL